MRRRAVCAALLIAVLAVCGTTAPPAPASAQLRVTGSGRAQRLVRDQFSPEMRARYDLFAVRCTRCHAMSRPIAALTTGITPVTGGTFDDAGIQRYVVRMMRKPNSGIDRQTAREILLFLRYARRMAQTETLAATPRR